MIRPTTRPLTNLVFLVAIAVTAISSLAVVADAHAEPRSVSTMDLGSGRISGTNLGSGR